MADIEKSGRPAPGSSGGQAMVKPKMKFERQKPWDEHSSDRTPSDATGINPDNRRPIDPKSPFIPPP